MKKIQQIELLYKSNNQKLKTQLPDQEELHKGYDQLTYGT
jgi:hypothetical protein